MSAWSFYSPSTGLFTGRIFRGDNDSIDANTPDGTAALEGEHDHLSRRVDLSVLTEITVVDWQPPAPVNTALETFDWKPDAKRWVGTPTSAALAHCARKQRDGLLASCDWVATRAAEDGSPIPADWKAYRAALRNITLQAGFPVAVQWPTLPG